LWLNQKMNISIIPTTDFAVLVDRSLLISSKVTSEPKSESFLTVVMEDNYRDISFKLVSVNSAPELTETTFKPSTTSDYVKSSWSSLFPSAPRLREIVGRQGSRSSPIFFSLAYLNKRLLAGILYHHNAKVEVSNHNEHVQVLMLERLMGLKFEPEEQHGYVRIMMGRECWISSK